MTREQAIRAYVARCEAVDRLTARVDHVPRQGEPSRGDLIQLAGIQARLACAAAQIVAALSTTATTATYATTQEG